MMPADAERPRRRRSCRRGAMPHPTRRGIRFPLYTPPAALLRCKRVWRSAVWTSRGRWRRTMEAAREARERAVPLRRGRLTSLGHVLRNKKRQNVTRGNGQLRGKIRQGGHTRNPSTHHRIAQRRLKVMISIDHGDRSYVGIVIAAPSGGGRWRRG